MRNSRCLAVARAMVRLATLAQAIKGNYLLDTQGQRCHN
jgi:hypothetical protein